MNINDKGRDYAATAMTDNELDTVIGGCSPSTGSWILDRIKPVLTVFAQLNGIRPRTGPTPTPCCGQ
jgi:bacteriocin-like protein